MSYRCPKNLLGDRQPPVKKRKHKDGEEELTTERWKIIYFFLFYSVLFSMHSLWAGGGNCKTKKQKGQSYDTASLRTKLRLDLQLHCCVSHA